MAGAAQESVSLVKVNLKGPDGSIHSCQMTREVLEMINSPNCDPEVKRTILQSVMNSKDVIMKIVTPTRSSSPTNNLTESPASLLSSDSGSSQNPPLSSTCSKLDSEGPQLSSEASKVHNWTEKEEKNLISIRLNMEEEFNGSKSHEILWNRVKKQLEEENIIVTLPQIMNKWKNLKKRYKEVVDNNGKTGSERVTWKHLEAFNSVYGNKASTKVQSYFDSTSMSDKVQSNTSDLPSSSSEQSEDLPNMKTKTRKRRKEGKFELSEKISKLEETAGETLKELKEHNAKSLQRLDRFLDIFEKSVNMRKNTDSKDEN